MGVFEYVTDVNNVYLYPKWASKYSEVSDVAIDPTSLDEKKEVTIGNVYSCFIKAYDANTFMEKSVPVYRNFYLKEGTKLPAGLELNRYTGEISGTPTKVGTYTFVVQMANDELKAISEKVEFTIVVKPKESASSNPVSTHTIKATAGANGSITYEGKTEIKSGRDITYNITSDRGYAVKDVIVDGKSIGAVDSYTFNKVKESHEIEVTFKKENASYPMTFKDVEGSDWFYNSVKDVVSEGIMNGVSEDMFAPNDSTTRGMIVTILYRMSGSPAVDKVLGFGDVAEGSYYADAVAWAAKNGIVLGCDASTFAPDNNITREQLAAILHRYSGYEGYNTAATSDISGYSDYDQISAYAINALKWANELKLITGYEDGSLNPQGEATRAQVATILDRFCDKIEWEKAE